MQNTNLARAFRQNAPSAERRFWSMVRAGRLGGFKFRRQVPIGRYVVDFVCMDTRLIVELDGVSHQGREEQDAERTAEFEGLGYRVRRFSNSEVLQNRNGVALALLHELDIARPRLQRSVPILLEP